MLRCLPPSLAALALLIACSVGCSRSESPLGSSDDASGFIGAAAPPLDIAHWVQCKDLAEPISEFEPGHVYVVEFWATWCGPCIHSMPHLAELQEKYADQNVHIISISDEDLETVQEFLQRPHPLSPSGQSVAEMTDAYCITTDPDRSVYNDYMTAANQGGIPTAFIVGKEGRIEWVGHPMEMDEPLEQIVTASWNREAFNEKREIEQQEQQQLTELRTKVVELSEAGRVDEAVRTLDEAIAAAETDSLVFSLRNLKLRVLGQQEGRGEELEETLRQILEEHGDEPQNIYQAAQYIYLLHDAGRLDAPELRQLAIAKMKAAAEEEEGDRKAAVLDALAHLQQQAGDIDGALESEQQAVEIAGERIPALQEFVDELKAQKEEQQ